jgi:hypothetical protein
LSTHSSLIKGDFRDCGRPCHGSQSPSPVRAEGRVSTRPAGALVLDCGEAKARTARRLVSSVDKAFSAGSRYVQREPTVHKPERRELEPNCLTGEGRHCFGERQSSPNSCSRSVTGSPASPYCFSQMVTVCVRPSGDTITRLRLSSFPSCLAIIVADQVLRAARSGHTSVMRSGGHSWHALKSSCIAGPTLRAATAR